MADLIVDYHALPSPVPVAPTTRFALDRDFLSAGADDRVSRAPNAPYLRHMDGRWWLVNGHGRQAPLAVYVMAESRRFTVAERCAFPLPDGESEVHVWDSRYRVHLTVSGSAPDDGDLVELGPETSIGLSGAAVRVQLLLTRKPRHRTVLAAYYREYFTPGIASPAPLGRTQTRLCLGLSSFTALERALDEVTTEIWGEAAGHRHELPDFLIRERLLVADDQKLVPHRLCRHRSSS
ncbi:MULTISPECIES: hypothetical protein [Actinokineospora]|uniref:Uncharacterized protein n=1 Tax=Actinokineospora fastidiosa TaxID=1816 RepID=A0A918L6R4_9PSEU|nr:MULTISPECIES: hypothetical protein [Actinokineospora]UVS77187.1 hypothetical protein Actkin_00889 [Actinokineospora sp. UTMC 2448]GGS12871.1 hypothetical protein GCM10010171_00720 [Actinokineospora fastidiosa]